MSQSSVSQHDRDRFLLIFFFVLGCLLGVAPVVNSVIDATNNKDHSLWYDMGLVVRSNGPLYELDHSAEPKYMYPPPLAVLVCAPLSYLGPVGFSFVFSLMNAVAWSISVWAAAKLITETCDQSPCWRHVVPGIAVAPYVWDIQLLGQTNLVLLALTLTSFLALRNNRRLLSGTLFGIAVAIKVFPLPAIAYFIVRREWKPALTATVATLLLVCVIPGAVRGYERNFSEVKQWTSLMIADQSGEKMAGRSSIGFTRRNQSLISVSHRLLRKVKAGNDDNHPLYVNFADVSPKTAQIVGYAGCLALGIVLLIACRLRFAASPEKEGLEIAMVCTLVPLCSPLAWTYFFCWLLMAWTALRHVLAKPQLPANSRRIVSFGATFGGVLLLSAISEQFDPTLQAYGVTAWGTVALFLTLAYARSCLPDVDLG